MQTLTFHAPVLADKTLGRSSSPAMVLFSAWGWKQQLSRDFSFSLDKNKKKPIQQSSVFLAAHWFVSRGDGIFSMSLYKL